MGVDNQAAIRATKAFHSQPGHYLVDLLHDDLRKLIPGNDERKLTIRWTPGHRGIIGNKAADIEAKKAANGDSSEGRELPKAFLNRDGTLKTLPKSKAALKQNLLGRGQNHYAQLTTLPNDPFHRPHRPVQQVREKDTITPKEAQFSHLPTVLRPNCTQQTLTPHQKGTISEMPEVQCAQRDSPSSPTCMPSIHTPTQHPSRQDRSAQMQPQIFAEQRGRDEGNAEICSGNEENGTNIWRRHATRGGRRSGGEMTRERVHMYHHPSMHHRLKTALTSLRKLGPLYSINTQHEHQNTYKRR